MNSEYELVMVAQPNLNEEDRAQLVDQIKKKIEVEKGEVLKIDDWGKRPLAYEIKKNNEGFYYFISFKSSPKVPSVLNSRFRLMEEFLRYLIVRKEEDTKKANG